MQAEGVGELCMQRVTILRKSVEIRLGLRYLAQSERNWALQRAIFGKTHFGDCCMFSAAAQHDYSNSFRVKPPLRE